jgi:hypothetical protein
LKRFVDEGVMMRAVERGLAGTVQVDEGTAGAIEDEVRKALKRLPRLPKLVSRNAAAKLLGVQSPHLSAPWLAPRLPKPVKVEGSADVWIREEIVALAKELEAERAGRKSRRKKGKVTHGRRQSRKKDQP